MPEVRRHSGADLVGLHVFPNGQACEEVQRKVLGV